MTLDTKGVALRAPAWSLSRKQVVAVVIGVLIVVAAIELAMGRVPMCTCGTIKLWHGIVALSGRDDLARLLR